MTFVLSLLWMTLQRGRPLFLPGKDRKGGVGELSGYLQSTPIQAHGWLLTG